MKSRHRSLAVWASLILVPLLGACGTDKDQASESEAYGTATIKPGQTISGRVVNCHDGDTCNVRLPGKGYRSVTVRLGGIDAPEVSGGADNKGQPMGQEAKSLLNANVKGKDVRVKTYAIDPYGRVVGEIFVGDMNMNMQQVEKGFAEAYKWADKGMDKKAYRLAESKARSAGLGIWTLGGYESPGTFRQRTKTK